VVSFPLAFPSIICTPSSSPPFVYMARPSHPPLLDYSNYTWRRVQITKLLIMQFSPFSRHLIPLRSKCPPQYPVRITVLKFQIWLKVHESFRKLVCII
jgi:hypothetical protein